MRQGRGSARRAADPASAAEVLLLVVGGTIADCDDVAAWGAAHLGFLRRHLPCEHGVPGERWLTILMNRISPGLWPDGANGRGDRLETHADLDKGHGRIEERRTAVLRQLDGARRFPGELRRPGAACLVRAGTRVEAKGKARTETRYFISSRTLPAAEAATTIRDHPAIENRLHRSSTVRSVGIRTPAGESSPGRSGWPGRRGRRRWRTARP